MGKQERSLKEAGKEGQRKTMDSFGAEHPFILPAFQKLIINLP